jgi:ABC-type cobalamin/Fe3+-siderophores transport system ATPase subunit
MGGVVVVGPCAAGKTTLVRGLRPFGVPAAAVAQEHSQVHDLYRRRTPAAVVYLAASWPVVHARRPQSLGHPQYLSELERLTDARDAASLIVHTDGLSIREVRDLVLSWWTGFAQRPE